MSQSQLRADQIPGTRMGREGLITGLSETLHEFSPAVGVLPIEIAAARLLMYDMEPLRWTGTGVGPAVDADGQPLAGGPWEWHRCVRGGKPTESRKV